MPNLDVIEKHIPATTIAHITALVTDQSEIGPWIGPAYERLMRAMQRDGYPVTGPSMAWYRSEGDRLRIAAAFPTTAAPDDSGTLRTELDEPVVVEAERYQVGDAADLQPVPRREGAQGGQPHHGAVVMHEFGDGCSRCQASQRRLLSQAALFASQRITNNARSLSKS